MARYLDPKADLTFKKVFGEHKDLVKSLLNALLPLEEGHTIKEITYLPPERVPRTVEGKDSIVDVCCEAEDKRQFIVEMQTYWSSNFKQRVLFNSSKVYVSQLDEGDPYEKLQPVYSLNLVDAIFEPDIEDFYHYYRLVHDKDTKKVIEGMHIIFVELPKFKPQNFSEKKMQVLWLRFLTEINKGTETVAQELLDNPEISKALRLVEESAYSRNQLLSYDMFWDRVRRDKSLAMHQKELLESKEELAQTKEELAQSKEKLAQSEEKLAQSKEELAQSEARLKNERHDTARKLKAMNVMTTTQIAEATGLTAEEIEAL